MVEMVLVLDFDGVIARLNVDWATVYRKVSEVAGYKVTDLITFWKKNLWHKRLREGEQDN